MAKPVLATTPVPVTHVLMVEDDASDAFLIEGMLHDIQGDAFELYHAKTQAEAVALLARRAFDVCLLDMTLPDADGFSALIHIQEKAPQMPVLMLTGMDDALLARQAVGRGAQDYLLKHKANATQLLCSINYAMERKRLEKDLIRRADSDALTGLANRSQFESRMQMALARARRLGNTVAVLFADLDKFKQINDTFGHAAGDVVLKTVADRLQSVLRVYDTVARLGGDEFAVLLEGVSAPRDAAVIAQKIIAAVAAPISYHEQRFSVEISIGIVIAGNSDTTEALLQQADAAMYRAKQDPGSACQFYTPILQKATNQRLQMEAELRAGISNGELRLCYQPYIAALSGEMLGVEALLRWAHPLRGLLLPGEFVRLAEQVELMPEINKCVFSTVCRDLSLWSDVGIRVPQMTVNVSASQLDMPDFVSWLTALLAREHIDPQQMALDISEEALISSPEARLRVLTQLRQAGISLHLDQFGAGPVSLRHLYASPLSLVKIDRSLVEGMTDNDEGGVLVRTAVAMARQLELKIGAMGVETLGQKEALTRQRCDSLQGYIIGMPMNATELAGWLNEQKLPAVRAG